MRQVVSEAVQPERLGMRPPVRRLGLINSPGSLWRQASPAPPCHHTAAPPPAQVHPAPATAAPGCRALSCGPHACSAARAACHISRCARAHPLPTRRLPAHRLPAPEGGWGMSGAIPAASRRRDVLVLVRRCASVRRGAGAPVCQCASWPVRGDGTFSAFLKARRRARRVPGLRHVWGWAAGGCAPW